MFVYDNMRIQVCRCEADSSPQTLDDLILGETRTCDWLHQIHQEGIVDSLGPEETVGVVECEDVGGAGLAEDMTRRDLLPCPLSSEGRQLRLLTLLLAGPAGQSDRQVSSVRDERPAGEVTVQLDSDITQLSLTVKCLPQLTFLSRSEGEGSALSRLQGDFSTVLIWDSGEIV